MKKLFIFFLLLSLPSLSQTKYGTLTGSIVDEKGEPLYLANIIVKDNNYGTSTDKKGKYKLVVKPGIYKVEISFIGFETIIAEIEINSGVVTEKNFILKSTSFLIGGIEVIANNEFLPNSPETKSVISSNEIEHMQASSLNDVLKLTPGVETTNPTLNYTEKAIIRSGDALGTQIVLDGIPLTNNANLQVGIGYSTANSGLDLRFIPAENIKEVEIIRGIPSVKYGDMTDGLMIVKTRSSADPLRTKIKYNPRLYEFNVSKGFLISDWTINANFNLASSERDIRVEGDGYTRIAAQITFETGTGESNYKNLLYFTRSFDEYKEKPGYELREAWYNRDINIKYSGDYSWIFNSFNELAAKISVSYTRQNSYAQQLISRDNIVISDRLYEGTQIGRIVFGSYLGKKNINGDVWNLFSDINYTYRFFTGELLHTFLGGINFRSDFNKGEGIVFDPLYPPSLSTTTPRLRKYSDIPAYNILSLYVEDKIVGNLWKPFTLQIGLRYEAYRPSGFNLEGLIGKTDLIKSNNGSFLNPRITFSYNLSKDTQIRFGYGTSSKSPPLGMIFAQDKYYDIVDSVKVVNPAYPDSNFSLISTFIRPEANPNIKGYKQKKYEFSYDQQFEFFGFSITGYINNTKDMFNGRSIPTIFLKRFFPDWPKVSNAIVKDTLFQSFSQYSNNGWQNVKGIEVTLSTKRIPVINTIFKFDAAYIYSENGLKDGFYFSSARFVKELNAEVMPMFKSYEYYNKDLLLNYRFEIQARELGLWLTLHIQQKLIEIDGRRHYDDTLAVGYFTAQNELIIIPEEQRNSVKYAPIKRVIQDYELLEEDKPNKWLINIKVSKSLWKGAAVSFYVNNFFNNQPLYKRKRSSSTSPTYDRRNPDIFYGVDFSSEL